MRTSVQVHPPSAPRPAAEPAAAAPLRRPKVLICEDDEPLRELIRVSLGDGYDFVETADGQDALAAAERGDLDLLVLDIMVPGLDGLEVLRRLRRNPETARLPIVAVTAWKHLEDDVRAAGASAFVGKPFEPDELRQVVESVVVSR